MANLVRNFIKGRMNKSVDERLVPNGEYIDAQNIRMGSTEESEIGAVENTRGNEQLTEIAFIDGTALSAQARCIGAYADSANETIYWFIHDSGFPIGPTGKLDLIVSFNVNTEVITYHVVSINDNGFDTTLNFDPAYLITGVSLIDGLLFFTDNVNPPRRINVTENYPNPTQVLGVWTDDPLLGEDILVIKRPPVETVQVTPSFNGGQDNYMEERFISFAYRYRYANGEYSATSQFSEPSFVASPFSFSPESFLNEGMVNATNSCEITYNSGSSLVVGIELLFKEMDDSIIRVIERIDKDKLGLSDNTEYSYSFDNNQIFTILPESEILRLYDNVPRLAKAQTIMGNRLVYGNYLEGYNLTDASGYPIQLGFSSELRTEEVGFFDLTVNQVPSSYTYNGPVTIPASTIQVDCNPILYKLTAGSSFTFSIQFNHAQYTTSGGATDPITTSEDITVQWTYTLDANYAGQFPLSDMISSGDFLARVGAPDDTLSPMVEACNDISVFTNAFNCAFPEEQAGGTPTPVTKAFSGIDSDGEPIRVSVPAAGIMSLQFPAIKYINGAANVFEYYSVVQASVSFNAGGTPFSLKSNRNYEVGMVYMDDFARSSTALVSSNSTNSVHVPCGNSIFKNNIRVTIPTYQRPPGWATRYKFVIKPDREGYETIYSTLFVKDELNEYVYLLLEGENTTKVEVGDRYIVKRDTNGATSSCVYATVLDKETKVENFLGDDVLSPAGTYMKMRAGSFAAVPDPNSTVFPGWQEVTNDDDPSTGNNPFDNLYPILEYTGFGSDGGQPLTIPAGSRIRIQLEYTRAGRGDGNAGCERREMFFDQTFVADAAYDDIIDWFYGQEGVIYSIENAPGFAGDNETPPTNQVLGETNIPLTGDNSLYGIVPSLTVNKMRWYRNLLDATDIKFVTTGTKQCGSILPSDNRRSKIRARFEIFRTDKNLVFETQPSDSLPDLWYESSESYPITGGFHEGNVTNQTAIDPAVVDTAFFNCIAFGNGIESYKIRDSVTGKPITLGNRVTTTTEREYEEALRFADLTYSGVYNDESNVNKLNEFNRGLLNFKPLEESYGPVEKLFARKTDILTLQEDKISYVLAGKNLLTDSTGESVVASVPQVLGTQVARTENFGISNNPESFTEWGPHKFFTDAKRGSVIHLFGDGTNESLEVVSENGMRSWFRDAFIENFNTQKLGGYDPYMNEYVLTTNDIFLPGQEIPLECGVTQTFLLDATGASYSVDLGQLVGTAEVTWDVLSYSGTDSATITTDYDGTIQTSGPVNSGGNYFIQKNSVEATTVGVNITFSGTDRFVLTVTIECVESTELTVRMITLTNEEDAAQTIHHEYRWADGANFISPTYVTPLKFLSGSEIPIISQYQEINGFQGSAYIPTDTSSVTMASNRIYPNNFILDTAVDRFYYLRTNVDYGNNIPDIVTLMSNALPVGGITPLGGPAYYYANFPMSATGTGDYLYLIWDYQQNKVVELCYSNVKADDACCGCVCDPANCQEYSITNNANNNVSYQYRECGAATNSYTTVPPRQTITICSEYYPIWVIGDRCNVDIEIINCDC